ncbi:MAG: outer membrane beta-barrel protein [Bacteroidales bacterium]|nr:outer membrane beta-barrel protein [Bacteroidales bacterium]
MKHLYLNINIGKIIFWAICLVFIIVNTSDTYGQRWKLRRYEIGGGLGNTQIFGDIGGTMSPQNWMGLKDIQIKETRPSVNVLARYKINNIYTFKTTFNLGFGYGSDATSGLERQREYSTTLLEFSSQIERYIIQEERPYRSNAGYRRLGMLNNYSLFGLYVYTGVGACYTRNNVSIPVPRPKADVTKNNNFTPVIPLGIGIKYIIDDAWNFDCNLGYRFPFNDYIEGYTQIIDSKYNDIYYILSLSITYRLKTSMRNIPMIFEKKYKSRHDEQNE